MATRNPTTTRTTAAATATSSVRRNLFHHHLSRRPTPSSTSTSATATTLQASPEDTSADIVIRDKNGNYQVEVPLVPEEGQDDALEKEKEDARLAEAVKHHWRERNIHPTELMAAVQASLRGKAASIHEDNWMYEADDTF